MHFSNSFCHFSFQEQIDYLCIVKLMQHVLDGFLLVNILCSTQLITLDGMMDHLKWVNVILGDILLLIDKLAGCNQLKIF